MKTTLTLKNSMGEKCLKIVWQSLLVILLTMLFSNISIFDASADKNEKTRDEYHPIPAQSFQAKQKASVYPTIEWDKTIGGFRQESLSSVIPTLDGGYLLAGSSESGDSGDKSEDSRGEDDYWIVKIDAEGNKVWDKTFGGNSSDLLSAAILTSDGGYLLAGSSESDTSGNKSEDSKGGSDYWIVKIDANGNKVWDKTIGGSGYDALTSVIPTPDGGYLLAGSSESDASGDKSEDSRGEDDYWIVKIDAQGNKAWDKTFGGNSSDLLSAAISTSDGGYLLAGYSESNASGDKSGNNKGREFTEDYWIIKIDAQGNKVWDKTIGGNSSDLLSTAILTPDGGYLLAGSSHSNASGDKSENDKRDFGGPDYWIIKIDAQGNKVWDKTIGGTNPDELSTAILTPDGGYLLAGSSMSNASGDKSEDWKSPFYEDYWVVKVDAEGSKVWDKTIGGNKSDNLRSIVATSDGSYLLAGNSESETSGDKSDWSNSADYWIVKLKDITTPVVTSLALIDARTDQEIRKLKNKDTVYLAEVKSGLLNIKANTFPEKIDHVRFKLVGPVTRILVEEHFPYALFGDDPTGDYKSDTWVPGKYILTVTPFAKGEKGPSHIVYFEVTDTYEITGFTLIDASLDTEEGELSDGDTVGLASFGNHQITIRANTKPARLGKVTFSLEGPVTHSATEQNFPYSLFNDVPTPDGYPDYKGSKLTPGAYTLTAVPYSQDKAGSAFTISFEVADAFTITGFTLIDATRDQDIGKLSEGDVIDVTSFDHHPLAIRANTEPMRVGKVTFSLEGPITHSNTELAYPYILFGNGTSSYDGSSFYIGKKFTPGTYTLTATPYALDSMGVTSTITFTVIDSESATLSQTAVYPVPTSGVIHISHEAGSEEAHLMLLDFSGNILLQQPLHQQPVEQLDLSGFKKGIYYLKIISPEAVRVFRVVKE